MSEKGKEAGIAVTAEELARINRFAKKELRAEEVYTFAVKLCDNEVCLLYTSPSPRDRG